MTRRIVGMTRIQRLMPMHNDGLPFRRVESAAGRLNAAALAPLLALIVVLLAMPLGWPPAAQAQGARSVRAERLDVKLEVQQGGDVLVTETHQIRFQGGPFQMGFVPLPGRRLEGIDDVRVSERGQAYRQGQDTAGTFRMTRPSGSSPRLEWWFTPTTDATRTFEIRYRARQAVAYYDSGDQLRWDVIGPDLEYGVAEAAVTLTLPVAVTGDRWLVDANPSRYTVDTNATPNSVTWTARNIPSRQSYETRAQWPHGLISGTPPAWQAQADREDQLRENLGPVLAILFGVAGLAVPVGGAALVLVLWYTRGRDPSVGKVPAELEQPPDELMPALVGVVMDEHADARDVVATLLDLAARGVITITEVKNPELGGSQRDFDLRLIARPKDLHSFEDLLLKSIFVPGDTVRLSHLGDWFGHSVPRLQRALHALGVREGLFYDDPEITRQRYRRAGSLLMFLGVVAAVVSCGAAADYSAAVPFPFFGLAIVGLVVRLMASRMPQRTPAGALAAAQWRAYGRHLAKAEPGTLRLPQRLAHGQRSEANRDSAKDDGDEDERGKPASDGTPNDDRDEFFERALPYAVALGIDTSWVDKLANLGTTTPRWLQQPPVVVVGGPRDGPGWGGPMMGPGGRSRRVRRAGSGGAESAGGGPVSDGSPSGLEGMSRGAAEGLERTSGSLADLLNAASEVLARGGGSKWSGGGRGGGRFTGGGGGGRSGGGGFR